MWRSSKIAPGLLAAGLILVASSYARAASHPLEVKVILARKDGHEIDPKLKKLAKELEALKFKSVSLLDQATFDLELGASGRMQLPGGEWMTVEAVGVVQDTGQELLRTVLTVAKLEFKATVQIAARGTVVIPGPGFRGGTLLLAVTRGGAAP